MFRSACHALCSLCQCHLAWRDGGEVQLRRGGVRQNHLLEVDAKRAPGPTWETVRYMVAAIQYGGRITDEFDKFLMQTYAERYFHQVPVFHCCAA